MCAQCIPLGELDRDHAARGRGQPALLVETGQLDELTLGIVDQLVPLLLDQNSLAVALAADRYILTERNGHRSPDEPAAPAAMIAAAEWLAPATPTTMAATDTIPSLAPNTPALIQSSRPAIPEP
jgi:hypothetical protein